MEQTRCDRTGKPAVGVKWRGVIALLAAVCVFVGFGDGGTATTDVPVAASELPYEATTYDYDLGLPGA
jgi:hypothetical protein